MTINDAAAMLRLPRGGLHGGTWADLGCGNGTFTLALASVLPAGSHIFAIDELAQALEEIPETYDGSTIVAHAANFIHSPFPFNKANGILMANALHYVADKHAFLTKIKSCLEKDGCLLLVEYDTDKAVPHWVPYPVSYSSLTHLIAETGFGTIEKLHSRRSAFGGNMYSAIIYN